MSACPPLAPTPDHDTERFGALAAELDALRERIFARVGRDDVLYLKRITLLSRALEATGRVLLHVSVEPAAFSLGVLTLWLHKQLEATEIGHPVLHGTYDHLHGAEAFAARSFRWRMPIDEESWRRGHNVQHHGNTGIAGRDPDIRFGSVRLTTRTAHRWFHFVQVFALPFMLPNTTFFMNMHFTGLSDVFADRGQLDVLEEWSPESVRRASGHALRKYAPYYLREYVFFPALAGPLFWKVALGNYLSEVLRDLTTAAAIYCGHVGEHSKSYPRGTKAQSRGEWCAMQVEATNDFEVSLPVSVLCGGLDRHIEHHLFPTLPPRRLREIAPEVRAICERHGVQYRSTSWPRTLLGAFRQIARLSRREALERGPDHPIAGTRGVPGGLTSPEAP